MCFHSTGGIVLHTREWRPVYTVLMPLPLFRILLPFFPHGSKNKYNNITDDISVYMCIEQIAVKSQFNPFESPGQFMKEIANGCHMTSFSI